MTPEAGLTPRKGRTGRGLPGYPGSGNAGPTGRGLPGYPGSGCGGPTGRGLPGYPGNNPPPEY